MSYFPTDIPYMSDEELKENGLKKPYKKPEIIDSKDLVPVVHGKWIHDGHHRRCNRCGTYFCNTDREGDTIPDNFCPNCGAKMDREE